MSVDPLTSKYPMLTPYQFASNSPIQAIDLDGLEILPINSSIYRQKYLGTSSFIKPVTDHFTVEVVYKNIPDALKNPITKGLKFTYDGVVGTHGRDYDGPIVYSPGRLYNSGPAYYGKSSDAEMEPTNSTRGLYNFDMSPDALEKSESNANRLAAGASALKESFGMGGNFTNQDIWYASGDERYSRSGFYKATSIVDRYLKRGSIQEKGLNTGKGRADLINFLTDGTLPELNSKPNLKEMEYNLRVIYSGYQIMRKEKDIPIRGGLQKKFEDLNKQYKDAGGTKNFEKIYEY